MDGVFAYDISEVVTPITLQSLGLTGPGAYRLAVRGPAALPVRVQRSFDLLGWSDWRQITLENIPVELTDSETAGRPQTFYRVLAP